MSFEGFLYTFIQECFKNKQTGNCVLEHGVVLWCKVPQQLVTDCLNKQKFMKQKFGVIVMCNAPYNTSLVVPRSQETGQFLCWTINSHCEVLFQKNRNWKITNYLQGVGFLEIQPINYYSGQLEDLTSF